MKDSQKTHITPPKYWRFVVLFGSHMGNLLSVGLAKSLGVFLVRFKEEFNTSSAMVGLITTLVIAVLSISGLAASMLCKRYSYRSVVMAGGLFMSIGLMLTSFATNILQLILCIDIITGIGIGLSGNPCILVIARYFDENYATANGLAMAGVDVGMFILPPLADYLSEVYGWRGALIILSGICLNVSAMGALFRPNPRGKEDIYNGAAHIEEVNVPVSNPEEFEKLDNKTDFDMDNADIGGFVPTEHVRKDAIVVLNACQTSSEFRDICTVTSENDIQLDDTRERVSARRKIYNSMDLAIFSIPKYMVFMPVTMIVSTANTGMLAHIVARGISEGVTPFKATFLLSGIAVTSMVSRATHGIIIDKGLMSAARLYTVALTIASAITFLSLFCNSFSTFLIYSLCYGVAAGTSQCIPVPIVKSIVPSRTLGGAIAWMFIFRGTGSFLGGFITGALFDATGDYDCSYMVIAGLFLLAAVLMVAFSYAKGRKKRRDSLMPSPVEQYAFVTEI